METLCSGKFEFFVVEKIGNKTFKALKLATSDFFIATLFDESKKKNFISTLNCSIHTTLRKLVLECQPTILKGYKMVKSVLCCMVSRSQIFCMSLSDLVKLVPNTRCSDSC